MRKVYTFYIPTNKSARAVTFFCEYHGGCTELSNPNFVCMGHWRSDKGETVSESVVQIECALSTDGGPIQAIASHLAEVLEESAIFVRCGVDAWIVE